MKHFLTSIRRAAAIITIAAIASVSTFRGEISHTLAAGSWAPTLLVNTESFQSLENGDASTNIELQFGRATLKGKLFYDITNNRFKFDRDLFVGGTITATGSIISKAQLSGATLRVEGAANVFGALTTSGALKAIGATTLSNTLTVSGNTKVRANLSGSTLTVDGAAQIYGALTATGTIKSKTDITINSDSDTNDATLNFGNYTAVGTLKYLNTGQKFQFNKGIDVLGSISGSTLVIGSGGVKINKVQYQFTGTQGGANTFLKNDGAGNLTWGATAVGNGSGSIVEYQAEYPNSTYFSSGAVAVGQLSTDYDTTNKENFYHWVSTRSALNDYWVSARVKVPKNFSTWTTGSGITLRYRTTSTSNAVNYVNVRVLDTAGATITSFGSGQLLSSTASTWRTTPLPISGGTFTPGGSITVLFKLATTTAGTADIGKINFNWNTTTP